MLISQCPKQGEPREKWTNDPVFQQGKITKGASINDVRKHFGFFDQPPPPVCKFTQPPLLRLLTMSAFEGTEDIGYCDYLWTIPKV